MTDQQYIIKLESALNDAVDLLEDISDFWAYGMNQRGDPDGFDLKYVESLGKRTAEVLDKAGKVRG